MIFVFRLAALCAIASFGIAHHASAAPPNQAIGYVSRIEGVASLVRNGATRDLRLGETVFVGDVISATPPAVAKIDTRSGQVAVCAGARSPTDCHWLATVQTGIIAAPDWWSRSAVLATWVKSTPTNLVTRSGGAPKLSIGLGVPQRLAVGRRPIAVPLNDGSPPYQVRLLSGDRVVAEASTTDQIVRFANVDLPAGPLELLVVDSTKSEARARLVGAVAPALPDVRPSAVDSDHHRLLEAGWLAVQDGGIWRLEAYQRLDTIAARSEIAALLSRALAAGQRP